VSIEEKGSVSCGSGRLHTMHNTASRLRRVSRCGFIMKQPLLCPASLRPATCNAHPVAVDSEISILMGILPVSGLGESPPPSVAVDKEQLMYDSLSCILVAAMHEKQPSAP
jgi:hypothetical protein